jgi:hypothetical protein
MDSKQIRDTCKIIANTLGEGVSGAEVLAHLWPWLEVKKRYVKIMETGDVEGLKKTLMWERLIAMKAEAVESKAREPERDKPTTLTHKLSIARWYRRMFNTEEEAIKMLQAASNAIAAHELSFQEVG